MSAHLALHEVLVGSGCFGAGFFAGVRFKTFQIARRTKEGRHRG